MFVIEGVLPLCNITDLQVKTLLCSIDKPREVQRGYICPNNMIFDQFDLSTAQSITNFIASQHFHFFKDKVPDRQRIARLGMFSDEMFSNLTYYDKIAFQVLVVLDGEMTYEYKDLDQRFNLTAGTAYLINNRSPRRLVAFKGSPTVLSSMWIDFDLLHHLTEDEKTAPFNVGKTELYA